MLWALFIAGALLKSGYGKGGLHFAVALSFGMALVLLGVQSLAIGIKTIDIAASAWVVILAPLWIALPIIMILNIISCVFLGRSRGGCFRIWDCARPEPSEGIAISLSFVLISIVTIPLLIRLV
jgi:hypothetical protein